MSATDGFSAYIAAPAVAALRRDHPRLTVEIVAATRRAAEHRAGLDLEVVVGVPQTRRAHAVKLGTYTLGMYASRDYLDRVGTPSTAAELEQHQLVYFVDSMLQVDALDLPRRLVPRMQDGLTSTNVFVHVEATRAGAGIGLLPVSRQTATTTSCDCCPRSSPRSSPTTWSLVPSRCACPPSPLLPQLCARRRARRERCSTARATEHRLCDPG